jgi:DNA-binding response OmpR family regulator
MITDQIVEDRQIRLYQAGADLIIQRPYSARLLVVQMRALLRRSARLGLAELPDLTAGGITLNPVSRQVETPERERIHLTNLEFRLLHTLMVHAGHVLSTEYLLNAVWGYEAEGNRELVRGLIQRLRLKLETEPHQPRLIQTESGVGYWFNPSADR